MNNFVFAVIILFSLSFPIICKAQDCKEPPKQITKNIEKHLEVSANLLTKIVGSGEFEKKSIEKENDVYHLYPNADKMLIKSHYIYIFCTTVRNSKDLTTQQKLDALNRFINAIEFQQQKSNRPDISEDEKRAKFKPFKESAASLFRQAADGVRGRTDKAASLVDSYSKLVRRIRSGGENTNDAFIRALNEFDCRLGDANQAAWAIADLAKGLEVYLETFKENQAFQVSMNRLAERAAKGVRNSLDPARMLACEYNFLLSEIQDVFREEPGIRAREKVKMSYEAEQAVLAIADQARELADVLANLGK